MALDIVASPHGPARDGIALFRRVSFCGIPVHDQEAALAFWTRTIGLIVVTDEMARGDHRVLELAIPGADTGIALVEQPEHAGSCRATFECADVQDVYRLLTKRGVEFTQPPRRLARGTRASFIDPDGNVFTLTSLDV